MLKDYAKRNSSYKPPRGRSPTRQTRKRIIWVIAVLIVIVFLGFLSKDHHKHGGAKLVPSQPVVLSKTQPAVVKQVHKQSHKQPLKIQFQASSANLSNATPVYIVQIATVSDDEQARLWVNRLHALDYKPHIHEVQAGNERWYRIQLGPYKQESRAKALKLALETKRVSSVIVSIK